MASLITGEVIGETATGTKSTKTCPPNAKKPRQETPAPKADAEAKTNDNTMPPRSTKADPRETSWEPKPWPWNITPRPPRPGELPIGTHERS